MNITIDPEEMKAKPLSRTQRGLSNVLKRASGQMKKRAYKTKNEYDKPTIFELSALWLDELGDTIIDAGVSAAIKALPLIIPGWVWWALIGIFFVAVLTIILIIVL